MKPKLNMTTRGPSRKEVIILITKSNAELIMKSAHKHITNINECLKNSNSDIIADFICLSNNGIIITMNRPANVTELSRIENFLKKIDNIDPVSIEVSYLPKSNMNPGISQCKNCWKWGHSTLSCHSHISRCAKCYGAHITEHHREKVWCCMDNKKAN